MFLHQFLDAEFFFSLDFFSFSGKKSSFSMQTKIIALAVAGLVSGAAFAQTNVTLYGVADAAYVYGKIGNNKFSGIENGQLSGNRLGVKGEEALGNGLKAIFTYEWAATIDGESALGAPRQSFVGLSGGFGTFSLGRQYSPSGSGYLGATDPWGYGSISPLGQVLDGSLNTSGVATTNYTNTSIVGTLGTGGPARWSNSVAYQSPNFSGFDFRVVYAFGETVKDSTGDASKDAARFGIGGSYKNGPLFLTLIYEQQ
ncbi:MAG: porin, partial [Candidatus Accumulibacter sp.]|nr:porin [Accumulibacter sp.]